MFLKNKIDKVFLLLFKIQNDSRLEFPTKTEKIVYNLFYEGKSHKEIAEILGTTEQASKNYKYNAERKKFILAEILSEHDLKPLLEML